MSVPPTKILIRRGLAADWPAHSLSCGELGLAYDSGEVKIGLTGGSGTGTSWAASKLLGGATGQTGAIQRSDGKGNFIGDSMFYFTDLPSGGSGSNELILYGGDHGNQIKFDDGDGNMTISKGGSAGDLTLLVNGGKKLIVDVHSTQGSAGQVLGSDGQGSVIWTSASGQTVSGNPVEGSILYQGGSGTVAGYSNFTINQQGDSGSGNNQPTITGGDNGNRIVFDDGNGKMIIACDGSGSNMSLKAANFQIGISESYGSAGQVLGSDGSGNLAWVSGAGGSGSAATRISQIQSITDSSDLQGSANQILTAGSGGGSLLWVSPRSLLPNMPLIQYGQVTLTGAGQQQATVNVSTPYSNGNYSVQVTLSSQISTTIVPQGVVTNGSSFNIYGDGNGNQGAVYSWTTFGTNPA
jgi:hypothetical protein